MNKKIQWLFKLSILTFAIYWFITDGFTSSASQVFLIAPETVGNNVLMQVLFWITITYLLFTVIRGYYRRNSTKPKSDIYKKYQEK